MTAAPEPAPLYPPPPQQQPKKRNVGKIILIVVAAVVVLFVLFIAGIFFLVKGSTADAQKVSDQLVTAIQTGDGAKAYALTGPSFRAATTEAQLTELVKNLSTLVTKDKTVAERQGDQRQHRQREHRRLHLHDEGHQREARLLQDPDPQRGRGVAGDELPQLRDEAQHRGRVSERDRLSRAWR